MAASGSSSRAATFAMSLIALSRRQAKARASWAALICASTLARMERSDCSAAVQSACRRAIRFSVAVGMSERPYHGKGWARQRLGGAPLGLGALRGLGMGARLAQEADGEFASATGFAAQQPMQRLDGIALHAMAGKMCRAQHDLRLRVTKQRRTAPPVGRTLGAALDTERVVMDVAQPRHGRGASVRRRPFSPPPRALVVLRATAA